MPTERAFVAALALLVSAPASLAADAAVRRDTPTLEIVSGETRLAVEVLDDGLIHFEFAPTGRPRGDAGASRPGRPDDALPRRD